MRQFIFATLVILTSCSTSKVASDIDFNVTLTKTACGSYGVIMQSDTIGYIVKPLYFNSINKATDIASFEKLLKLDYKDHYHKFKRQYWFTLTRASDTLIFVTTLSPREMKLVPNWRCEEQDVDVYNKIYKLTSRTRFPRTFSYNCTKGQWTQPGED